MATDKKGEVQAECVPSVNMLDDMTHTDSLGRSCAFYNRYKATRPDLCLLPFAQTYCRLTCGLDKCIDMQKTNKAYYLWDGIRHVVPHSSNGSVCLNDKVRHSLSSCLVLCDFPTAVGGTCCVSGRQRLSVMSMRMPSFLA